MNVRHEVSVQGRRDPKGPYAVSQRPPDVHIKHPVERGTAAARLAAADGFGQQGFVGESRQHEQEHEDAQHTHRVCESHALQQTGQHERERDGEHAAARRHDAVHQAQSPLEIVTQDHQTRLIRKAAATGEDYAVGEVQRPERPAENDDQTALASKAYFKSMLLYYNDTSNATISVIQSKIMKFPQ